MEHQTSLTDVLQKSVLTASVAARCNTCSRGVRLWRLANIQPMSVQMHLNTSICAEIDMGREWIHTHILHTRILIQTSSIIITTITRNGSISTMNEQH